MNRKQFFDKVKAVGIIFREDLLRIQNAYWLAELAHHNQKRYSGERYFEHPQRVACNIMTYCGQELFADEISAALLHDAVEDGFVPADAIRRLCGERAALLVEKLSKICVVFNPENGLIIKKIKKHMPAYCAGMQFDKWACLIKFADKLDNLRDMGVWPKGKQREYLEEAKAYILPLADKAGLRETRMYKALVAEVERREKMLN